MIVSGITSIGELVATPPRTTSLPAVGVKPRSIASPIQFAGPRMFASAPASGDHAAMICLPLSAFAPPAAGRGLTTGRLLPYRRGVAMEDYFAGIEPIRYEGPESRNPLSYRYYDADRIVAGKRMADHFRFAVAYWHTFRGTGVDPFGQQTLVRPWDDPVDSVDNALRRMRVAFDFISRLGVGFYCFHDRDIAPEGASLAESNRNLDQVADLAGKLQADTGIRLLWGTANLFANPRYMNGAATNPDAHVFAYAAAQVKKAMEVTHRLGGANYVFWGGREGYATLLNTDMKREQDHLARFLHMAADYAREIGFDGTLLIEPKPKEPTTHQYDFDAATVLAFLRGYGLDRFKLNVECNHATLAGHTFAHELQTASDAGLLGSIDANTGDELIGWDTDQFNLDPAVTSAVMMIVLRQGGIAPGGFNFDAKLRRESTDIRDMFAAHVGSIDAFARGLLIADRIIADGTLDRWRRERYASYDTGTGAQIESGAAGFRDLERWVLEAGEPEKRSGRQEQFENLVAGFW